MTNGESTIRSRPVIRVFVSSTFSDLVHERNALQEKVFRPLERLCLTREFQFQAIDLRWGVSKEASLDHRAMRICFEELRRSQAISPQPNFVILLGDRYGWRPLPEAVSQAEFDSLVTAARSVEASNPDRVNAESILREWYRLDANVLPTGDEQAPALNYRLQSRLRENAESGNERTPTPPQNWPQIQRVLWRTINTAFPTEKLADRFHLDGKQDRTGVATSDSVVPQLVRFQASATEQEIWCGALAVADAQEHVTAYFREIENLAEFAADRRGAAFYDVNVEGEQDRELHATLAELKNAIREHLPGRVITPPPDVSVRLELSPDGTRVDISQAHLAAMCRDVLAQLTDVVVRQMDEFWQNKSDETVARSADDARGAESAPSLSRRLNMERETHRRFGEERSPQRQFTGREQELLQIRNYLNDDSRQPLVIHGSSGCGKTALLAQAAQEVAELRPLTRFLGLTPQASQLRGLLTSLCQELQERNSDGAELPPDLRALEAAFFRLLTTATADRPIVLFLDALDQLDPADGARALTWLRLKLPLPPHVKLCISCTSDDASPDHPWAALQRSRVMQGCPMIGLHELTEQEAATLLFDRWLGLPPTCRTVSQDQRSALENLLKRPECRLPIFLRLLFEEVRQWPSYDPPPELGENVTGLLEALFDRLCNPRHHGSLVRHALSYLAAARYGLSETELLEVLFSDPEYQAEIQEHGREFLATLPPGVRRIPIALWSRLRFDLEPYLAERSAPGGTVLGFYHRQVGDYVRDRFLQSDDRRERHVRLADYFGDASVQPLWLRSDGKRTKSAERQEDSLGPANERRLAELPWQQLHARRWDRLERTLTDGAFLEAKLTAGLGHDLLGDFARLHDAAPALAGESEEVREHVDRCRTVGRLLGNVFEMVQLEPTSVLAQLQLELQEVLPGLVAKYATDLSKIDRPWLERLSVHRDEAIPYFAQTAIRNSYTHSLHFSLRGDSILYFDNTGQAVRWDWERGGTTSTKAPHGGYFRNAAVLSNSEVLLTCLEAAWLMEVGDVWHDDFSTASWRLLGDASSGLRYGPVAACREQGWAAIAAVSDHSGRLLKFTRGAESFEPGWRLPHASGGEPLVNHIAFSPNAEQRAVCFGDWYLALNTGLLGIAHEAGVYEAVYLSDQNQWATVGGDTSLAIWDPLKGLVQRVDLVPGNADSLAFCPQRELIAVGHRSGAVTLLQRDQDSYEQVQFSPGILGWVMCLRFSPCGKYLAVGGRGGVLRLFEVSSLLLGLATQTTEVEAKPQGLVERAIPLADGSAAFYLDEGDHLYSTGPKIDSAYLPQKCQAFCMGRKLGPVAVLIDSLRFLDRETGKPSNIHSLPMSFSIAAALSNDESLLALLQAHQLTLYRLAAVTDAPVKVREIPLAALWEESRVSYRNQRGGTPLIFYDNDRFLAIPLEPRLSVQRQENGKYPEVELDHVLACLDVATGKVVQSIVYRGICRALTEIGSQHLLALGLGAGRVHLVDPAKPDERSYFQKPSPEAGVVYYSLSERRIVRHMKLPAEDGGVTALAADPTGEIVLVGCQSGRIRATAASGDRSSPSVVLPSSIAGLAITGRHEPFLAVESGNTSGHKPTCHQLVLRSPIATPPTESGDDA